MLSPVTWYNRQETKWDHLQTDFWKMPCTSECPADQDDSPETEETRCLLNNRLIQECSNLDRYLDTHLHVSLQLFE